ncbi:TerC family protein [Rhodomicrobium sp. Az07]|uniref:TerC family protein n=1 Tax=Rhodomicrobium sp. Az07 TaxID=2839034 RepID=UPI001BE6F194|nr:TerC family protein [Rhodomicrobium sp. Az07]
MELLLDPAVWVSLVTLTALEIVLGIDNIVVLSILTQRLPPEQARQARAIGLGLALVLRILMLFAISWIIQLTYPVFSVVEREFSWRDMIMIGGGLFLLVKATQEIHASVEGDGHASDTTAKASYGAVIAQIALMDAVFSLDSIIMAVGLAQHIEVMVAAVCIAIAVMFLAANPVAEFIKRHPTTKMLGLAFLFLIGVALIADGFEVHIPRGYIYFAMGFAAVIEAFNIWAKGRRERSAPPSAGAESKKPGTRAVAADGAPSGGGGSVAGRPARQGKSTQKPRRR